MNIYIDPKNQMLGVWCGAIFLACFAIGMAFVAPLVPPPSPAHDAEAIRAFFADNATRIKIGCFITMMGAGFQVPLFVTLLCQMARMERGLPFLGLSQLAIGSFNCSYYILGPVIWVTAAFRPEGAATVIQALNDLGWMVYFFIISPAIVVNIAIAIAIFRDYNKQPILPRWLAYVNIWVAVCFLPEGIMPFFREGPFAWNGVISFWVVIAAYFTWMITLMYCLRGAILKQGNKEVTVLAPAALGTR